ncbi:DUF4333 domain-containing protein [Streptomyces sp. NPDC001455]|uniref:DUF4333 domain-containing protein n=1 Tax=unclassified Streptomyces TaxID=2593676 RepID=UPI00093DD22A|nr:DUF4333 domain-containing protein [Streptomyces sp. CB01580]OKJ40015.1 hypothetical protein AMK22_10665 [Streptomyces sp. CB01580]
MTEQGKFTRALIGLSALVVAVCAVIVTVKVVSASPQPHLLDQEAVERQASAEARSGKTTRDGVACPAAIEAKKGNKFECKVKELKEFGNYLTVLGEVTDDQGDLSMTLRD